MKIAVFRALQIGDLLCTVPAFRALRKKYPRAEICLIGLPWSQFLVNRLPYIDRLIPFSGLPGLPEVPFTPAGVVSFIQKMQEEKFDLILQMQGNGSIINPFIELFQGKKTAGFFRTEDYYPSFNTVVEYPEYGSEIHRMLTLIMGMGIPLAGDQLEFPLISSDYEELRKLHLKEKYICIHPGARDKKRRWPPHLFALLGDYCVQKGYTVYITGTKEEESLAEKVKKYMKCKAVNLAGKTSLGGAGALIANSNFLISGDTGVVHIAAALKKASFTISQNSDPERWTPLNKTLHYTFPWKWSSTIEDVFRELGHFLNNKDATTSHADFYRLTH